MNDNGSIYVDLDITNVCDRKCTICQDDSDMKNPIHLTRGCLKRLLRQIKIIGAKTFFTLAGGGEPLLNHKLPEIVKMISDFPLTNWFSLITSGFLKNETEKDRLSRVIRNANKRKFALCLSLHTFNNKYAERFEETFAFLLNSGVLYLRVMATASVDLENLNRLEGLIEKSKPTPFLVDPNVWARWKSDSFLRKIYDEDYKEKLIALSHFSDCWYRIPEKGCIVLDVNLITKEGRARKTDKRTIPPPHCSLLVSREKFPHLRIDSSGNYYPHPCCNPKEHPNMAIGTVKENLKDIIQRRKIISEKVLGLIIKDPRIPKQKGDLCSLCSKIKAELDARA